MKKQRSIYLHINDIKKIGLETWFENFYWPVPGDTFVIIYHELRKAYHALVDTSSGLAADLLISEFKIIYRLAEFLCALRIKEVCDHKGFKIIYSGGINFFDMALAPHGKIDSAAFGMYSQKSWRGLKQMFRLYYFMFRRLARAETLQAYLQGDYLINIGKLSYVKKDFLDAESKNAVDFTYQFYKVISNFSPNAFPDIDVTEPSRDIVGMLSEVARNLDIAVSQEQLEVWKKIITDHLRKTAAVYGSIADYMSSKKNLTGRSYLIDALGSQWHRLIALCAQKSGGMVFGFAHGNPVGIVTQSRIIDVDLSIVNTYLVPTTGAKDDFEHMISRYKPVGGSRPDIRLIEDESYYTRWRQEKEMPLPKKIEKVMFIEHPTIYGHDSDIPFAFQPVMLDFAIRVLKCLKGRYHVMLSAHPDALKNSDRGRIYSPYIDEIICSRFENNYAEADAIVFGYAGTTFGFTIPTNKRMIYFDYILIGADPEKVRLLNLRCHCIKTWSDERNRLQFEEAELLRVLSLPPEKPDINFLKNNMSPASAVID